MIHVIVNFASYSVFLFAWFQGPTSYGPVVEAAIDIVERSGGQYHVLVIIADGQVTFLSLSM